MKKGKKSWSKAVRALYNYICDTCGSKKDLTAHHLESSHANPKLRLDINNGVCLCSPCHRLFHFFYSYQFNTREQYEEFKRVYGRVIHGDG